MQSFLQYRRFGNHIRRQYERDREKAAELARRISTESPATPISADSITSSSSTSSASSSTLSSVTPDAAGTIGTQVLKEQNVSNGDLPVNAPQEGPDIALEDVEAQAMSAEHPQLRHVATVATEDTMGTHLGMAMTGIEVCTTSRQDGKVFVVGYEGEKDGLNPRNWNKGLRVKATILIACIGFVVGFASSVDSAVLQKAAEEFAVSDIVESLATGIFLIGFGFGALMAGPVSETIGRNPVYITTLAIYMVWIMASALAPNIAAQLAFRFLAGFFGATPLVCAGGSISDLWDPMERVYTFPVFANASFLGPILGPIVGGFIGESSKLGWRWTEWITLIMSGVTLILLVLFQPETYAPILLKWKASHLRDLTGDERFKAAVEIREDTFLLRLRHSLYRPFLLTLSEPIIMLVALYLSLIYIILFSFLNGHKFIFTDIHGFSGSQTGMAFLGIAIGLCLCSLLVPAIYWLAKRRLGQVKAKGGVLAPEFRLWFAMLGAPAIPISIFWLGWTSYPSVSYWSPLAATILFGFGILTIFISTNQYIIDIYTIHAASALASVTCIRYVAAGVMVEVALPMYRNLGVRWTCTLLGALSVVMVPVPYAFWYWGRGIRERSRFVQVRD
ncbi:MAG: hypothetical protein M1817_000274 [Caeruleum heppii]|nr:MAG: hypothetical protein M1817_000274 [Caeruleum heppii]